MERRRRCLSSARALRTVCLVTIAVLGYRPYLHAQSISVTDLGTLGGLFSGAIAINDAGDVVGWSTLPAAPGAWVQHATRWVGGDPAAIQDLGTLCGPNCSYSANSGAMDINDAGQIVGWSEDATHSTRAFIWDETNGMRPLPPLSGDSRSWANAINNLGQVVGVSSASTANAVRWVAQVPSYLGPGAAQDIKNCRLTGDIIRWLHNGC